MRIPLNYKKRDEEALDLPGDIAIWAILHLKLACPACGKIWEPTELPTLVAKSVKPLTLSEPITCPNCQKSIEIRNDECLVDEEPLPALAPSRCFNCDTAIGVAGSPQNYAGNCPPLCTACFMPLFQGTARAKEITDSILKKAAEYGLGIRL